MKKMVPKAKQSKKAQREMNGAKRVTWAFSPVSRIVPNKKKTEQAKRRPEFDDSGWRFFIPETRIRHSGHRSYFVLIYSYAFRLPRFFLNMSFYVGKLPNMLENYRIFN